MGANVVGDSVGLAVGLAVVGLAEAAVKFSVGVLFVTIVCHRCREAIYSSLQR